MTPPKKKEENPLYSTWLEPSERFHWLSCWAKSRIHVKAAECENRNGRKPLNAQNENARRISRPLSIHSDGKSNIWLPKPKYLRDAITVRRNRRTRSSSLNYLAHCCQWRFCSFDPPLCVNRDLLHRRPSSSSSSPSPRRSAALEQPPPSGWWPKSRPKLEVSINFPWGFFDSEAFKMYLWEQLQQWDWKYRPFLCGSHGHVVLGERHEASQFILSGAHCAKTYEHVSSRSYIKSYYLH